ncbi:MAG: hypothetical protein RL348_1582, partial [Bacteroidota bacterium]
MQKKFEKDQKVLSRSRLLGSLQSSKESIVSTSCTTLTNHQDSLQTLKDLH